MSTAPCQHAGQKSFLQFIKRQFTLIHTTSRHGHTTTGRRQDSHHRRHRQTTIRHDSSILLHHRHRRRQGMRYTPRTSTRLTVLNRTTTFLRPRPHTSRRSRHSPSPTSIKLRTRRRTRHIARSRPYRHASHRRHRAMGGRYYDPSDYIIRYYFYYSGPRSNSLRLTISLLARRHLRNIRPHAIRNSRTTLLRRPTHRPNRRDTKQRFSLRPRTTLMDTLRHTAPVSSTTRIRHRVITRNFGVTSQPNTTTTRMAYHQNLRACLNRNFNGNLHQHVRRQTIQQRTSNRTFDRSDTTLSNRLHRNIRHLITTNGRRLIVNISVNRVRQHFFTIGLHRRHFSNKWVRTSGHNRTMTL